MVMPGPMTEKAAEVITGTTAGNTAITEEPTGRDNQHSLLKKPGILRQRIPGFFC
jgi:hypothetical protein